MTAVGLPWREGPAARHRHTPGKSSRGRMGCVCEACHQDPLSEGNWGDVGEKKPQADSRSHLWKPRSQIPFTPTCWLEICSLMAARTKLPQRAVRVVSATWGCSGWDAGKPGVGGWNARRVHEGTALGQTDQQASAIKHVTPVLATGAGVLGQLSLWLSIADSWQFNFTPQVPHYLCRHLKNMWALDRISDQWQRLQRVQVVAVKVKVSVHELAVVGIHDKGSLTDKQSVRLKRMEICQGASCRL